MRKKVKIGEKPPHPFYVPLDLIKEGFVGETDIMADAKTITILHPNANLEEVAESLMIILRDVNLRRGLKTEVETELIEVDEKDEKEDQA